MYATKLYEILLQRALEGQPNMRLLSMHNKISSIGKLIGLQLHEPASRIAHVQILSFTCKFTISIVLTKNRHVRSLNNYF